MKKLLLVLAIGAFAACGGESTETTTDSTSMMSTDTTMMSPAPVMPDTTGTMGTGADSSSRMGADSTK